jgi:hypothetical protein
MQNLHGLKSGHSSFLMNFAFPKRYLREKKFKIQAKFCNSNISALQNASKYIRENFCSQNLHCIERGKGIKHHYFYLFHKIVCH